MNAGLRGEQQGLKTNLLENTITVRVRKCPPVTIHHAEVLVTVKDKTLLHHPS